MSTINTRHQAPKADYTTFNGNIASTDQFLPETNEALPSNEFFAGSTYLEIDKTSSERLKNLQAMITGKKIASWVGIKRSSLPDYLSSSSRKSNRIRINEARLINEHADRLYSDICHPIINIDKNLILEFKVIDSARETLKTLNDEDCSFREVSKELGFHSSFLNKIKNGDIKILSKKTAETIENHFNKNIFRINDIFDRACTEKTTKFKPRSDTISELTFIKISDKERENIINLEKQKKTKITKSVKCIYSKRKSISVRNAAIINKIADNDLIDISVNGLVMLPYSKENQTKVSNAIQEKLDKKVLLIQLAKETGLSIEIIKALRGDITKKISIDTAKKVNSYLINIFDFKDILKNAEEDALKHYKKIEFSAKKRAKKENAEEDALKHYKKIESSPKKRKIDKITTEEAGSPLKDHQEVDQPAKKRAKKENKDHHLPSPPLPLLSAIGPNGVDSPLIQQAPQDPSSLKAPGQRKLLLKLRVKKEQHPEKQSDSSHPPSPQINRVSESKPIDKELSPIAEKGKPLIKLRIKKEQQPEKQSESSNPPLLQISRISEPTPPNEENSAVQLQLGLKVVDFTEETALFDHNYYYIAENSSILEENKVFTPLDFNMDSLFPFMIDELGDSPHTF